MGGIEAGARHVPDLADAPDTMASAAGGGGRLGHRRYVLRPERPGRSILALSSSTSMLSSPMRCMEAQRFLSAHDQVNNLFHLRRDHVSASEYRAARARAFEVWADISGVAAAA
jgi:hypothetical protein